MYNVCIYIYTYIHIHIHILIYTHTADFDMCHGQTMMIIPCHGNPNNHRTARSFCQGPASLRNMLFDYLFDPRILVQTYGTHKIHITMIYYVT